LKIEQFLKSELRKNKDTTPDNSSSFIDEQHAIDEDKNSEEFSQRVKIEF